MTSEATAEADDPWIRYTCWTLYFCAAARVLVGLGFGGIFGGAAALFAPHVRTRFLG